MKARAAAYCDAFTKLDNNLGLTKEEMLILLKAYNQYQQDMSEKKMDDKCGWLVDYYDIGPGVFHEPTVTIWIETLRAKSPEYWNKRVDGKYRLSKEGCAFVESHSELRESAAMILGGITQLRRN